MLIFTTTSSLWAQNKNNLQLKFGDSVSIYSEKAYRKASGQYYEAIGNVVIISDKETLYGEKASIDLVSGEVKIEGSVRFISDELTVYGSEINFNMQTGQFVMLNARVVNSEFTVSASKITKKTGKLYYAKQAEFTTCRDCTESWQIYGDELYLELSKYVRIHHASLRVKGVDVLYIPFIALPVKSKRESGLLFPRLSSRVNEGVVYEQPIFYAISKSKDVTFTPAFLSERGYGLGLEYRHVYSPMTWLEFNNKMVVDSIYYPEEKNTSDSGRKYFRHFYELENHIQWSNSFGQHLKINNSKDLDFFRDYTNYTKDFITGPDVGVSLSLDKRYENFSLSLEGYLKRNILVKDPEDFDKHYVQSLPTVNFSVKPQILFERDSKYLYRMSYGLDSDFTTFKQVEEDETNFLRNLNRLNAKPFIQTQLLSRGPFSLNTKYTFDYQSYRFKDRSKKDFQKYAGIITTEFAFNLDRIFGLALEERYKASEIKEEKLKSEKRTKTSSAVVGYLPSLNNSYKSEDVVVRRNSYRHSQEFKLRHHQILQSKENGNENFLSQLSTENGWFDYDDSIRKNQELIGSNETRTSIPLNNTIEFQWNNSLIKKSPNKLNYLRDRRYLKDNFSYNKIGYFNISQGLVLDGADKKFNDKLTRLHINSSYATNTWSIGLDDYYFHQSSNHIVSLSAQKRFSRLSLFGQYNLNSFPESSRRVIESGVQFQLDDNIGFSFIKEQDLEADENISTLYQIDFMPNNNCWLLKINYKESLVERRYNFQFEFNFGNEDFKTYRQNFYDRSRLK